MTTTEQILSIANQLANQSKKPTVALIKTMLKEPVPLPTIISVLKNWQHQPDFTPAVNHEPIHVEPTQDDDIALKIEQALAPLKSELAEIKQLLKNLQR